MQFPWQHCGDNTLSYAVYSKLGNFLQIHEMEIKNSLDVRVVQVYIYCVTTSQNLNWQAQSEKSYFLIILQENFLFCRIEVLKNTIVTMITREPTCHSNVYL